MHSGFFHGGDRGQQIVGGVNPNVHMRHDQYGFRPGLSYADILIRDLQLLTCVFVVAFLVHTVFRFVYSQFAQLQRKTQRTKSLDPAPLLSIHDRLAAQGLTGDELLAFASEKLASFTLSNLVFALYRAGKLQVAPCAEYDRLLGAARPSVRKLKPRGAAHILWGIARVKPSGADDLVDELVDVIAAKLAELRAVDVICSLWAAAELGPRVGGAHRLNKLLLASDGVNVQEFLAAERVSVLATLAGAQVEAGAEWSGRSLAERALTAVAGDILSLHPTEQTKLVRAVCVLQSRELASDALVGQIFKAVGDSITDASQPLPPRLEVLTALPVASAAARNTRHVIARHSMDSQFSGLTAKDLVVLSATMAVAGMPESGEFYLELAQALRPLKMSSADERTVKAAFAAVGVSNLLDL